MNTDDNRTPLTPADCDLRGMEWMPLFGARLFSSDFDAKANDAEFRVAVHLWWACWQQVPAGSLPDDDYILCRLAGLGRDMKSWKKLRAGNALYGFVLCSDGRLYHRVQAKQAIEAWERRISERSKKQRWRDNRGVGESEWLSLRRQVFDRDGHSCVKCGGRDDLQCDHIIPSSKGGRTELDNLQTLCRPCNSGKKDKHHTNGGGGDVHRDNENMSTVDNRMDKTGLSPSLSTVERKRQDRTGQEKKERDLDSRSFSAAGAREPAREAGVGAGESQQVVVSLAKSLKSQGMWAQGAYTNRDTRDQIDALASKPRPTAKYLSREELAMARRKLA